MQARQAQTIKRKEMFIIIGLGDAVAPSTVPGQKLKKLACDIGGIFESVSDVPTGATSPQKKMADANLVQALSAFSRYFQATNSIQNRDVVSWSEIYEGANFPMEMTTAVAPVYDKTTDPKRWKLLGVAGIDVTTCDLEKKIYDKNPSVINFPAAPEETVIKGCNCSGSYTYKGVEYSGCTEQDWSSRWCATVDCGLPTTSDISTGKWADCKPFGVRAELEKLLLKSGEECRTDMISKCAIEALRPDAYRCGAAVAGCSALDVQKEAQANFMPGIPGLPTQAVVTADWVQNPSSEWDETKWSTDGSKCDQCKNSGMSPSCALPVICNASGIPPPPPLESASSDNVMWSPPGWVFYVVGGVLAAFAGVSAIVKYMRSSKRVQAQPPAFQPGPEIKVDGSQQQQQQYPPQHPPAVQGYEARGGAGVGMAGAAGGAMVAGVVVGGGAAAMQGGPGVMAAGATVYDGISQAVPAAVPAAAAAAYDEVDAVVSGLPAPDLSALQVPQIAGASEIAENMFEGSFLADAGEPALMGLLAAGAAAPIVGQVFSLLADLKKHLDRHLEAEEECRRMSVWCVSMMAVLGKLTKETTVRCPCPVDRAQSHSQKHPTCRAVVPRPLKSSDSEC